MLVTQSGVGENTRRIQTEAPKTWAYLQDHQELLNRRASSIYRNRPPYSVFGVGDYSFAPWKVAVSGFYKSLAFAAIGPRDGKPVVLDDTSYFLACQSKKQAEFATRLLNAPQATSFYGAFIFWDSKRPVTAELLRHLDLRRLAQEMGAEEEFRLVFRAAGDGAKGKTRKRKPGAAQRELWPNKAHGVD